MSSSNSGRSCASANGWKASSGTFKIESPCPIDRTCSSARSTFSAKSDSHNANANPCSLNCDLQNLKLTDPGKIGSEPKCVPYKAWAGPLTIEEIRAETESEAEDDGNNKKLSCWQRCCAKCKKNKNKEKDVKVAEPKE